MTTLMKLILRKAAKGGSSGTITTVTGVSPLTLANALAKPIKKLIQYGKVTTSGGDTYCNNGKLVAMDDELPSGYKRLIGITFDGNLRYETGEYLTGNDDVTMTLDNLASSGKNVFGSYNGANGKNFSLYIYGSTSGSYFRFGDQLKRPKYGGTGRRTITFGAGGTSGFAEDVSIDPDEFTTPANTYIGMLPNSSSGAYTGDIVGSILVGNRLEWIPCESDGGVIGYYEKFNGNFIAPSGSGTPVSLGYDNSHQTVLSVEGTPEVLTIGEDTASGAIASFETTKAAPVRSLLASITPNQNLNGYNNPWPAGGGKNLLNVPQSVSLSGAGFLIGKVPINLPAGAYTLSFNCSSVGSTKRFQIILHSGETQIFSQLADLARTTTLSFTTAQAADYVTIFCNNSNAAIYTNAMIESGSFATAYAPYSNICPISGWTGANIHVSPTTDAADGETYSITFPSSAGTVYGGTLDVTTGKLTVDRAMVDLGTLNWSGWTDSVGFIFMASVSGRLQTRINPAISSQYTWNPWVSIWTDLVNGQMTGQIGGENIYLRDTRYSSIADFAAAMSGVQFCYELATPLVYDLTPTEVSTLLGTNNVWSDAGDVTVTYAPTGVVQTASVVNLFAAGDVKDEQDIISGVVTRRTEVSVSGGVITVSALAEPVMERVTAQHLRTVAGDNTVGVTSNVAPVQLSAKYTSEGA